MYQIVNRYGRVEFPTLWLALENAIVGDCVVWYHEDSNNQHWRYVDMASISV